jgi:hypothetical protein
MESQHKEKINNLIKDFAEHLKQECNTLYHSGAIDPEDYDPEVYTLAKVIITAALHRIKDDYDPIHSKRLMDEVKNLILI